MKKTLIRHGNSLALVIDKPILEMLDISLETPLEVSTDGDALMIKPVRGSRRQARLLASIERINHRHGSALGKLAE